MRAGLRLTIGYVGGGACARPGAGARAKHQRGDDQYADARYRRTARASEFQPSRNGHPAGRATGAAAFDARPAATDRPGHFGAAGRIRAPVRTAQPSRTPSAVEPVASAPQPRQPAHGAAILDAVAAAADGIRDRAASADGSPRRPPNRPFRRRGRRSADVRLAAARGRPWRRRGAVAVAPPLARRFRRTDPNSTIFRARAGASASASAAAALARSGHPAAPGRVASRRAAQAHRCRLVAAEAVDRPPVHRRSPAIVEPERLGPAFRSARCSIRAARRRATCWSRSSLFNADPTQEQDIARLLRQAAGRRGERIAGDPAA